MPTTTESTTTDPGPDIAAERATDVGSCRCRADRRQQGGGHIRHRDRVVDRPDDDRERRVLPASAANAEDRLQYYASTFPLVEVDATYYALPSPSTARAVGRADAARLHLRHQGARADDRPGHRDEAPPEGHPEALPEPAAAKARIYAKDLPPELLDAVWDAFRDGLEPLREAGQLGSILLQYPRWFFPSSENRAAIEDAVERLDGMRPAVEFRNGSWLNEKNAERTLRFLTDRDIAFVMVDEPQGFKSSVPPVDGRDLADLAIVRFHGRNAETWEAKGITPAERFRYLYTRDELAEWAPRIREVAKEAKDTHILMNNCYANYGTTNAREMAAILAGELST